MAGTSNKTASIPEQEDHLRQVRSLLREFLGETIRGMAPAIPESREGFDFRQLVAEYERSLIVAALRSAGGAPVRAAGLLRLSKRTFLRKMNRLGVEPAQFFVPSKSPSRPNPSR